MFAFLTEFPNYGSGPFSDSFSDGEHVVLAMLGLYAIIFGTMGIVMLANHIVKGIGIYKMSGLRKIPNGFLGFFPYACDYQLGLLTGEIAIGKKKLKNGGLLNLLTPIIVSVAISVIYTIVVILIVVVASAAYASGGEAEPAGIMVFMVFAVIFLIIPVIAAALFQQAVSSLVLYKVFRSIYDDDRGIIFTVLSMTVPLMSGIIMIRYAGKAERAALYADSGKIM